MKSFNDLLKGFSHKDQIKPEDVLTDLKYPTNKEELKVFRYFANIFKDIGKYIDSLCDLFETISKGIE